MKKDKLLGEKNVVTTIDKQVVLAKI